MPKDLYLEGANVAPVVRALSNNVRLKILNLLSENDMNIQALASQLDLSKTAVLTHINLLEEAGFIQSQYLSGSIGNQRICHKMYDRLIFNFTPGHTTANDETYYETEIPVGNFFNFEAWAPCGLASHNNIIKKWDDPSVFCDPKRVTSMLVWAAFGFVEYIIPIDPLFAEKKITAIEIEMEISAQKLVSQHNALCIPPYTSAQRITDGISDITISINNEDIGTTTIEVGSNSEKATYTPTWWRSQPVHGFQMCIRADSTGCFINNRKTSGKTFAKLTQDNFLHFRVGIKRDALHSSGFMLFGKEFGSCCHDIIVRSYIE